MTWTLRTTTALWKFVCQSKHIIKTGAWTLPSILKLQLIDFVCLIIVAQIHVQQFRQLQPPSERIMPYFVGLNFYFILISRTLKQVLSFPYLKCIFFDSKWPAKRLLGFLWITLHNAAVQSNPLDILTSKNSKWRKMSLRN